MRGTLVLFICCLMLAGCSNEDALDPTFEVPEALRFYVDAFYLEASKRGVNLEQDNLLVRYGALSEEALCGHCNSTNVFNSLQKIVTISNERNLQCWNNKETLEALIFHELGHCLLGRDHNNLLLPNGDPVSLMIQNSINQYTSCVYQFGDDDSCNFTFKRDYYLDELFNPQTPAPEWAID